MGGGDEDKSYKVGGKMRELLSPEMRDDSKRHRNPHTYYLINYHSILYYTILYYLPMPAYLPAYFFQNFIQVHILI